MDDLSKEEKAELAGMMADMDEMQAEAEMQEDSCIQCMQGCEEFDERTCLGCVHEGHKQELSEKGYPCVYPGRNP